MRVVALVFCSLWSAVCWAVCEPGALDAQVLKAESAAIDDELDDARKLIVEALEGLGCLEYPVDAQTMAGLWQVSAAVEFFGASPAAANPDLARAKAIDGRYFRPRLGMDMRDLWWETVPIVDAQVWIAPIPAGHQLLVNGVENSGPTVEVLSGPNLVQIVEDGRLVFQRVVNLNASERAELETGLSAKVSSRRLKKFTNAPGMMVGAAGALVGLTSFGVAVYKDSQIKVAETPQELLRYRWESVQARNVALIAGAVGVGGFTLHFVF